MVNEGLRHYQADVTTDRLAAIRVEVSVIAFGNTVETVTPFVTASEFAPPTLVANGETMMGAAILQAINAVTVRKQQYKQNALHYYRPWIFMITDGKPTDEWQAAAAKVKEGEEKKLQDLNLRLQTQQKQILNFLEQRIREYESLDHPG